MLIFWKNVFWANWPALDFLKNLIKRCFFESRITKIQLREHWNHWRKLHFHCKINEYFSRFFSVLNCNFRNLLNIQFELEKQSNLYEKMNKISWQFEDVLEVLCFSETISSSFWRFLIFLMLFLIFQVLLCLFDNSFFLLC